MEPIESAEVILHESSVAAPWCVPLLKKRLVLVLPSAGVPPRVDRYTACPLTRTIAWRHDAVLATFLYIIGTIICSPETMSSKRSDDKEYSGRTSRGLHIKR